MLGFYTNFPESIHITQTFSVSISGKKMQRALVETLHKLNSETLSLEEVAAPSIPDCKTIFEVGVADGTDFNYLDAEEKERLLEALNVEQFQIMDFLCVIRYNKMQEKRRTRIRFDYYMLRFVFDAKLTEIRVFHEKGLMHTSPDDLIKLVVNRVNAAFSKRAMKPSEPA